MVCVDSSGHFTVNGVQNNDHTWVLCVFPPYSGRQSKPSGHLFDAPAGLVLMGETRTSWRPPSAHP